MASLTDVHQTTESQQEQIKDLQAEVAELKGKVEQHHSILSEIRQKFAGSSKLATPEKESTGTPKA